MRQRFGTITFILLMATVYVSGCGKNNAENNDTTVATEAESNESSENLTSDETAEVNTLLDITSESEVMEFLSGEWKLYDPIAKANFATLTIDKNGEATFVRDSSGLSVTGTFRIGKHQTYVADFGNLMSDPEYSAFELALTDIPPEFQLPGQEYFFPEEETTSGYFYVGIGKDYDYLTMSWEGNGDSLTFYDILQNEQRIEEAYKSSGDYLIQGDWLFRRANSGREPGNAKTDSTFYAYIWGNDGDKALLVQEMDLHTYDAIEEYVPRRYQGGYLTTPEKAGVIQYTLSKNTDISSMFNTYQFESEYPLMAAEITTDSKGEVVTVKELHIYQGSEYDLGDADQEFSYDGLEFTVNDVTFDLAQDYDSVANAILDMYQVGSWIVIECHVNPHHNIYYFYNIYTGNLEKNVLGANLTWLGDDITTAVYSDMNIIYNFKDIAIGTTDGDEVSDIEFSSTGAEINVTDFGGKKYAFEIADYDRAMYRYADFLRHECGETWKAFKEEAGENAFAYVLVNPPYEVANLLSWPYEIERDVDETCYVIPLYDNTQMHLDYAVMNDSGELESLQTITKDSLIKGYSRGFYMTIPEGVPHHAIYLANDTKGAVFQVSVLSNEHDQRGAFILASMTAKEAMDTAAEAGDYGEFDLADAYMDLLFKFKEAQEGSYSQEQVETMGLDTELIQHGWPVGAINDEVKYMLVNVDTSDPYELIITYMDYIIDIYGTDGKRLTYAFGTMYRGETTLYADGLLKEVYTPSMTNSSTTWYRYDSELGYFMPLFDMDYEVTGNDSGRAAYHSYGYESNRDEIVSFYKENGNIPTWAWEWSDEITEEEYDSMCSTAAEVDLSNATKISDFNGL